MNHLCRFLCLIFAAGSTQLSAGKQAQEQNPVPPLVSSIDGHPMVVIDLTGADADDENSTSSSSHKEERPRRHFEDFVHEANGRHHAWGTTHSLEAGHKHKKNAKKEASLLSCFDFLRKKDGSKK